MANKLRVFSGIKPSGELHIGNYLGALKQWVPLQERYDCVFCVVDYHAITVPYDTASLKERTFNVTLDYLAAGLDPKKVIIFVQSRLAEHTELAWILNTIVPVSELERMTQYKDKAAKQVSVGAGLLNYPVLMAADILLYHTNIVPVGEDQQQHVELARVVARKFNHTFGQTFIEPKSQLSESKRIMSLAKPLEKMGKSLEPKQSIALTDSPQIIREKVSKAVTDTGGSEGEMSPGVKNLFLLLKEFGAPEELKKFDAAYRDKSIRYSDLKSTLADAIIRTLKPFQAKRATLAKSPKKIWKILDDGAKRARPIAHKTLRDVKVKMGLA